MVCEPVTLPEGALGEVWVTEESLADPGGGRGHLRAGEEVEHDVGAARARPVVDGEETRRSITGRRQVRSGNAQR
jgi:hypothetical protein